jgi:hypothetical protein
VATLARNDRGCAIALKGLAQPRDLLSAKTQQVRSNAAFYPALYSLLDDLQAIQIACS